MPKSPTEKPTLKRWAKVEAGWSVVLKGQPWTVEAIRVNKKGTKAEVTVRGAAGTFTREMDATAKVEVRLVKVGSFRVRPEVAKRVEAKRAAPAQPVDKAKTKKRKEAAEKVRLPRENTEAERNVEGFLQGVPVATEDVHGTFHIPAVDPSTINAHLYLFHGIDANWPTGYAEAKALHDKLHAEGTTRPVHVHD